MTAVSKIRELLSPRVRQSDLLSENLTVVPSRGATLESLSRLEQELPRPLSESHRALLSLWNGLDLDVVRILGVPPVEDGITPITACQGSASEDPLLAASVAFASDPSGFVYFELPDGRVYEWDHDGGDTRIVASNIDEFIDHLVFGGRAAEFAGEEWLVELRALGLT